MDIEWKKSSKAKMSNRMLCNRLNEVRFWYRKAQAGSRAQTSQIMMGQKSTGTGLLMIGVKRSTLAINQNICIGDDKDKSIQRFQNKKGQ